VLLVIAIIFMRNQIRPIQRLANAAEDFGKGRDHPNFRPAGALEVRRASRAFIEMRERIERQIEQRTAMLAGVSHDLRTILTRFRLHLALLGEKNEIREMEQDVIDMQTMLEGYLDFARGANDEDTDEVDVEALLDELKGHALLERKEVSVSFMGEPLVQVRPMAFKRCLANITGNAIKFAKSEIAISGVHLSGWLTITVADDGPGIPEGEREAVFKPFYRLDQARNQNVDQSGTGLGLSIALDIARGHGGDITLSESTLGGTKAVIRIPA
ncbi:MAG: ATP-binding protein, partial [Pseudomonadota bacterium]